jgi:ABC-type nitrate/sulfonate/bicarbonate transport system permease component
MSDMKVVRRFLTAVWFPLLLMTLWWVWSANANKPFFPPLQKILADLRTTWLTPTALINDVVPSLRNLAIGYAIAVVIGIGVGLLLGMVPSIRRAVEPLLYFYRAIPPVALVPLFVVLLGFGTAQRVISIAAAAVFPIIIATIDGVRSVDPVLKDVTAGYHLTTRQRIVDVMLPGASPQIFAGLQVSLQVAFAVMVVSEMLGASDGLGAQTLIAQQSFLVVQMWSGILLLGLIGYLTNLCFDLVEGRVLRWYFLSKEFSRG